MNKIDFLGIILAERCNPNGDPLNGNRPRTNSSTGCGEITPECLKRKIRNRLQDMGERIFVQAGDRVDDGFHSQKDRIDAFKKAHPVSSVDDLYPLVCQEWIDARAFGLILPLKNNEGVTFGIRGPVSISYASSIEPVNISDILITRSENLTAEKNNKKGSTTMGYKYVIDKGGYVFHGSISPSLAKKTGFTKDDAGKIKEALLTLFENDASHARPSGSMTLAALYWWEHQGSLSSHPPIKLFRSVSITPQEAWPYFTAILTPLPGTEPEIYNILN